MGFDYSSIEGALTPEQAALALAAGEGETSAELENGGAPEATTVTDESNAADGDDKAKAATAGAGAGADTNTDEVDPSKAVVLARDGVHTIPYDTLVKHREGEQHWKAKYDASQQQLSELQAQAQARADAGAAPTKTDQMVAAAEAAIEAGADAGLFGDFSEEALANGIKEYSKQLIQAEREAIKAEVRAEIAKELAPLKQERAKSAADAHYDAIYSKHPDADSIAQSTEFKAWVDAQPSAVRAAYWGLFDPETGGTATQIVEVFDAFKSSSKTNSTTTAADTKAAASAAVASAKAKAEPPASLSAIPGARAEGASALDRAADMSGPELMDATRNMSPAQLEAWLDRQM